MLYFLNKFLIPGIYQGNNKKDTYFEGWYYKLVNSDKTTSIAIIPGISREIDKKGHSFIQVLINSSEAHYFTYALEDFNYDKHSLQISIGHNYFSRDKMILDLKNTDLVLCGEVSFKNQIPWSTKKLSLGTMGGFRLIPFMECYHEVISMRHTIDGTLLLNEKNIDFQSSIGYMEKDWGTSFPSAWIWIQCNHFELTDFSFMFSIARIPFLHKNFPGFLSCISLHGQLYKFTTYNHSKVRVRQKDTTTVIIEISNAHYEFLIQTTINYNGSSLAAPSAGAMDSAVVESINGTVHVEFYAKHKESKTLLFEGTGTNAGVEVMNIEQLI